MSRSVPRAGRRIADPPSIAALAANQLRSMILAGELRPGDRVVENRLTAELGVSRPPLREAMRVLEQEGLLVQTPRVGAVVTPLTMRDVHEIVSLREHLEVMAVRLGVPAAEDRLTVLRDALDVLEMHAQDEREDLAVEDSFAFHTALVGLAGHGRLEEAYRSLSIQMRFCMSVNRQVRAANESLVERAARHRHVFELVVAGEPGDVLDALHDSDSRSFVEALRGVLEEDRTDANHRP